MQAQDESTKGLAGRKYPGRTRSISASMQVMTEDCESGRRHEPNTYNLALLCSRRAARAAGRHASPPTLSFTKCLVWFPGLQPSGKLIEESRLLFCDRGALLSTTERESQLGAETLCSLSAVQTQKKKHLVKSDGSNFTSLRFALSCLAESHASPQPSFRLNMKT